MSTNGRGRISGKFRSFRGRGHSKSRTSSNNNENRCIQKSMKFQLHSQKKLLDHIIIKIQSSLESTNIIVKNMRASDVIKKEPDVPNRNRVWSIARNPESLVGGV